MSVGSLDSRVGLQKASYNSRNVAFLHAKDGQEAKSTCKRCGWSGNIARRRETLCALTAYVGVGSDMLGQQRSKGNPGPLHFTCRGVPGQLRMGSRVIKRRNGRSGSCSSGGGPKEEVLVRRGRASCQLFSSARRHTLYVAVYGWQHP
jgi:hypothetical protein